MQEIKNQLYKRLWNQLSDQLSDRLSDQLDRPPLALGDDDLALRPLELAHRLWDQLEEDHARD